MPIGTRSASAKSKAASSTPASKKRRRDDFIVEVVIERAGKSTGGRHRGEGVSKFRAVATEDDLQPIKGHLTDIVKELAGRAGRIETLSLVLDETKGVSEGKAAKIKALKEKHKREAALLNCFPSSTLRKLICLRSNECQLDGGQETDIDNTALWNCVTSCSQLKVLQWWSREGRRMNRNTGPDYETGARIDYRLKGTPLARCRLENFIFDAPYHEPKIDSAFLQMISQVKRLDISARFSSSQLESIFDTVKDVVEVLTFTNYSDGYRSIGGWYDMDALEAKMKSKTVTMPKLQVFNAAFCILGSEFSRQQLPSPYQIVAPRVTSLSFARFDSIDWVLIESCRSTLQSFTIGTGGEKLPDRLQQELFDMPALEELAIDLTNDNNCDFRGNEGFHFSLFWNAIDKGDTGRPDIKIRDVLPKLKSLFVVDDDNLSFERIMGLLKLRERLGLTPIESLTMWCEHVCPLSDVEIVKLKEEIPSFTIKKDYNFWEPFFCDMRAGRDFAWL